ncbi:MAG: hypothetical protein E4G90_03260 [Gemmatimonadales bacterium]|nr:MAG: hypothetical protein E4G90_03260 [Gemmatimonadales bacterium]
MEIDRMEGVEAEEQWMQHWYGACANGCLLCKALRTDRAHMVAVKQKIWENTKELARETRKV